MLDRNLIKQICDESKSSLDPISPEEVHRAVSHLNSKKEADEQGLAAEHLKHSGGVLIQEITDISNNILTEKKSPKGIQSWYSDTCFQEIK